MDFPSYIAIPSLLNSFHIPQIKELQEAIQFLFLHNFGFMFIDAKQKG